MTEEHRFTGIQRQGLGWYGTCSCGHTEEPTVDKDVAWEEIAEHVVSRNPALAALREEAALRRLLGIQE